MVIVPIEKVKRRKDWQVSPRTLKALSMAYLAGCSDTGLVGYDRNTNKNCCNIGQSGCSNIFCYEGYVINTTFSSPNSRFADNCEECYKSRKDEFAFKPSWVK